MKKLLPLSFKLMNKTVYCLIILSLASCTFTTTRKQNTVGVTESIDSTSFALSKKAVMYAIDNKADSLKGLLHKSVQLNDINAVLETVQTKVRPENYPSDSLIRISEIEEEKAGSTHHSTIYTFPFMTENTDAWIELEVKITDNKITSFFIHDKKKNKIKHY